MKFNWMKWALGVFSMLLLAACSSGGGGGTSASPANSMMITTTDAAGTKTTYTANNANSATITAHKDDVGNKTIIQICSDVDNDNDCSRLIIMTIDGTAAQKYSMNSPDSLTQIVYHDDETETGILSHYISRDGEIEVSEITEAGGSVKGAFTATLECNSGCSGNIAVTGNYNIALSK